MENLSPLLAFGGNSRAARSARARLQWRDRYGRFIDMGRGIKFKLNLKGFNSPVSVIGKFVGSTNDPEYGQVYVTGDKNGLPDGFYNVKSSNAAEVLATLDPNQLQRAGIQLGRHQDGSPVSTREAEDIQDADSIPYSPYPEGWTKQANGTIGTDDGSFYVQDAGKSNGYALYHNKQFVGYYNHTDWPGILSKSNQLDDEEEANENAPTTDHVAEAKAAVAPYDDDKGTAAKMIDDGKSGNDIIAHLDKNSPAWQQLNNNPGQSRSGIIHPQARQAQRVKNDIKAKAFRSALAKNHGNDHQLISAEDVAVPTAPNKSGDGTTYAVTLHDGSTHRMNRTENDIYTARRNLAVAQRNQNAKATADAQATLDKLEADAGISKPLQTNTPAPKSDTDTSTPAATPTAPVSTTPPRNNVPLVQNDNGSAPNAPYVLDPNPYKPTGQDDDPERIAKDFKQTDLQSALSQAISSGNTHVRLRNSTGQTSNVPAEAIRDAIQRQGSDTNVDLDSDVTINSTAEFDALPEGSQVEYNGELFTKDDRGRWVTERNGIKSAFPNMMYYANLSGRKIVLKKDTTPATPAPTPSAPAAPAAPAQPVRKAAKDLQPGDEIGGGTIVSVSRGVRTPNGKVDVVYTTPRGVRRTGQWWASTQIGLVNRPARPVAKLPDNSTPTPAPAAPNTPNLPKGVVRNPNYKPYDGSNTPRTDGRIGFKPSNPAIRSAAQTLLATRVHPTDDPRFDEAVDRLNRHGSDTSDTETNYIIQKLRTAPMASNAQKNAQSQAATDRRNATPAPAPAANAPANPAPTVNPTTPAAPVSNLEDDDEDIYDPNLVFDAIKRKYPNGKELKNGDYVIESRTVTGPKGAQLQYDTVVTRTSNEYFYVYMRETNLTTGEARSQRVGPMVHSAKALNNRIKAANTILNATRTPDKWFNSKRRRPNIKDDEFNAATGEFEHVKEQPILDSTVKAIHQAVNDDQVSEDLIRDVFDTISRFGTSDATLGVIRSQHNLSRNQLNDLIDNINAKVSEQDALSKFQTWVSADGVTPLAEGDIIRHKSGRVGTVQRRIVDHNSKGYEYSDYLFVQFHNSQGVPVGKYTNMTSRNLTLLETVDGTDGSERVGPNGVPTPQPTLSTRAQNRKNAIQAALRAHRQRTQAPIPNQTTLITRTPTGNSVRLPDGTSAPMNLTRHHVTADDTPVIKTADQLTPGDTIQIFDGNTGTNRLAQVVQVKSDDNGDVTVSAAVPDDNDSNTATIVGVVTPGMNGNQIQALLNAATDDDTPDAATASDMDRLTDAWRDVDVAQVDPSLSNEVQLMLLRHKLVDGKQFPNKDEVDDFIKRLQASPQRSSTSPAANLQAAINIAQSVVDDSDDDATGLQNSINNAKIKSDRINTPQGRVQAIIAENSVVHDLSDYNKIAAAAGSNPGGTYQEIGPGGRKIYLKEQADQAHADNEVLASALYRATGMNAVTVLHGDHPNITKPVTFSPLIALDPNKNLNSALRDPAMRAKIQNGFAVDAWLANWDATLNGNIDFDMSGNPVHVDVGGAIQFRATGPRRTNFDDNVDELKTLRDPRTNPQAAAVYGSMTPAEQEQSARQLLNITDSDIDALVSSTTKNSLSPQDQQALATTLKNRRANILKAYNIDPNGSSNANAAPAAQVPTPTPAPPANPVKPNVPVLNIRTRQDSNGVHYPSQPLTSLQLGALRRGTAQPPSLPFKTFDTDSGEVHYYDTTGTRRWGQYGAAGAMMRRKRADGTYEYLLAQRASTLSTGANLWSVPSGAHDTKADANTPGVTAGRELVEELGVDPSKVHYAGDYTSQPAPDWAFNYSFYDVDPGEYDTPPQVDPSEIQATRWVSQDEMKQMFDDGEMHDSITQGIFDGIHNTSSSLPAANPNVPAAPAQAPTTPAAPATSANIPNGAPITQSSLLDSAPVGQRMYYMGANGDVEEYEKQDDGAWIATYISSSPNAIPADDDLTAELKSYLDNNANANFIGGPAPRGNAPAAPAAPATAPTSAIIPDGRFLTGPSNIDSMVPGQRVSLNKNGDIVVYEKQTDGVWHAVNSNVSGYPIDDSDKTANLQTGLARSPQNYVTGDLITPGTGTAKAPAPAGHKPVPDGQQVDEQWIQTAPAGQAANLTNPITGQPQQLTKLSNGMWTDGSRMFSGTALSNFNKGRSPLLAGAIPKPPEPGPEDGQIASAAWMDNAPVGAKVHFMSSTGDQYTVTKRADGEWDVEDPQNGYPAVRKSSSMRTMAANGKVTIGPKPDLNAPTPPAPATPTQTALDDLLSTVDPDGRFSSRIKFIGKSDAELNDILNDVRAKTGGTNPLTDADLADLAEKYVPKTPQSVEDYFDRFDEIEARVKQLKADAAGRDPKKQHANYLLAAISEMNGHNDLPEIVNSVNDLKGDKIYRGVSDVPGLSAEEMLDQYQTSATQYAGAGTFGDGTYTSTDKSTAKSYAGYGSGRIMTAAINPADMKLFKIRGYGGYSSLFQQQKTAFENKIKSYLTSHGFQPGTTAYRKKMADMTALFSERSSAWSHQGPFDLGVMLSMQGYDAIQVDHGGEFYYVILNRGKLQIVKKSEKA